ncbi:MAG: hypothetical protein V1753_10080 [Pseudomonadota bacterium]
MEEKNTNNLKTAFKEINRLEKKLEELQRQTNKMAQALEAINELSQIISKNFERLAEQFIRSISFADAVIATLDQEGLVSRDTLLEAWEDAEKMLLGVTKHPLH